MPRRWPLVVLLLCLVFLPLILPALVRAFFR